MGPLLLVLLCVAANERPYDVEDMEGESACDPPCLEDGVCKNTICYCKSPYSGDYCQDELTVGPRLSIVLFIVLMLLFIVVGFLSAFCFKFIYDLCCIRLPKAPDHAEDEWPPVEPSK
mmetsp:Transcript_1913/g.4234  ORF Transcript_1913/g.4234 Transcript_1913/m.4234 type:complete len:118 (-) Transcript_1913:2889-3242(-)